MHISDSLQKAADTFFNFLPNLLGFLVILLVGWVVARIVGGLLARALEKVELDRRLAETDSGRFVENAMPGASAARGIGRVVFWLIFGFFVVAAVSALHIASVTVFMNNVLAYLPNLVVAILIFVVAALLAGAASAAINRTMGSSPMGKIASAVVPTLIMVIAMFMILEQLRIARSIVEIAFAATMGALALGLALAFGLGGRQVAQNMLEDAYQRGREERIRMRAASAKVPEPHEFHTESDMSMPGSSSARSSSPSSGQTSGMPRESGGAGGGSMT